MPDAARHFDGSLAGKHRVPPVVFFDLDETLVAQEIAFSRAYRTTAQQVAEMNSLDAKQLERDMPVMAQAVLDRSPFCEALRRYRFGGRDVLWADPDADTELARWAPSYRNEVWASVLSSRDVTPNEFVTRVGEMFRSAMTSGVKLFPEVAAVVERVARMSRLAVITNGMEKAQRGKLERLGIGTLFEGVIASSAVGHGKPSPLIYEHALHQMEVQPADAVMVGDSLDGDINGAANVGIATVWINRSVRRHDPRCPQPNYELPDLSHLEAVLQGIDKR